MRRPSSPPVQSHQGDPTTVRLLGGVSLLMDLANRMVYPISPLFLMAVLGAPPWIVGVIEGLAESSASLLKLYSGWLSDRLRRRKPMAIAGYGLGAISKLGMAASMGWGMFLGARLLDRLGKGLRAAPRDALIVEAAPEGGRGKAFGLHHTLEAVGEVAGPALGFLFLLGFPGRYRALFALAMVPAVLSVLLLSRVREAKPPAEKRQRPRFRFQCLQPGYRRFLWAVGLFGLANSSDAFLLMRAQDLGFGPRQLFLLYMLFNGVELLLTYRLGRLSDLLGRRWLLGSGWIVFALVYGGFAIAQSPSHLVILFAAYGLYQALTRGIQKSWVADLVNPSHRGAEIGTFYLVLGITALPASLIAGWLYTTVSPALPSSSVQ
ncbi:MAG: MFS transporter [Synechococcales cyanobacterium RM1_1_8]|nr:MFS transporter [Synechococcales cyanobacterium RM1_1_8]